MLLARSVIPCFGRSATSSEVYLLLDDVVRRHDRRIQKILTSGNLVIFNQALIAAHHLISLATAVLAYICPVVILREILPVNIAIRNRNPLQREIKKSWTRIRLGHPLDDISREVKILLLLRAPIEPHDRLEYRRARVS